MVGHGQTMDKPWFTVVLVPFNLHGRPGSDHGQAMVHRRFGDGGPATSNPQGKQKIVRNRGKYLTSG